MRGLVFVIWLGIHSGGLWAQSRLLPNPDAYAADSLLVILREDSTTNRLKAWLVNRTQDTVVVDTPHGGISERLKVKDEKGEWQCYDCDFMLGCGNRVDRVGLLAPNEFAKKTMIDHPSEDFSTEVRAYFTVNDPIRYSAPILVVIDAADIDSPERITLKRMFGEDGVDGTWLSRSYQVYGKVTRSIKKYRESRKACAKAIALNSMNCQVKFEDAELNFIETYRSKNSDSLALVSAIKTMFLEWEKEIPATEKYIWKTIGKRRKVYAKWLK